MKTYGLLNCPKTKQDLDLDFPGKWEDFQILAHTDQLEEVDHQSELLKTAPESSTRDKLRAEFAICSGYCFVVE